MKTTIELPTELRDRLRGLKQHPRQPYHEVIALALDAFEAVDGADAVLDKHRPALRRIATKWGLQARIIGSRAKGNAGPRDDLDIVVKLDDGRSLIDIAGFLAEAKHITGIDVHVREHPAIPEAIRGQVMKGWQKL